MKERERKRESEREVCWEYKKIEGMGSGDERLSKRYVRENE